MEVLEAEIKPLRDKEMGREVYEMLVITEDMEKEINNALGPGSIEESLSSRLKL